MSARPRLRYFDFVPPCSCLQFAACPELMQDADARIAHLPVAAARKS